MEEGYLTDFLSQLREEVMEVFSLSEEEATESIFLDLSGTTGWTTALYKAAQKTNHAWLISAYRKMTWYESDLFDGYLLDLMTDIGLITAMEPVSQNPYWDNIKEIAQRQRKKGLQHYGCGLEDKPMPAPEVIEYLQEELIDALMYCEHLKAKLSSSSSSLLQ